MLKQQDGGCDELLRHGSDAESSRGRVRNAPLQARHAIALTENGFPVFTSDEAQRAMRTWANFFARRKIAAFVCDPAMPSIAIRIK
jgi:hypothetical protein